MPLVEIENLSKVYRKGAQEVPVLRNLDLSVDACEFVALMGPSGSGKTTLLNLIAGIDRATSGLIRVGGVDLSRLSRTRTPRGFMSGWHAVWVKTFCAGIATRPRVSAAWAAWL